MKDLKHLIYFENLLSEANNELVRQAISEGKKAIGYTCFYVPEVLLELGDAFSVLLRAPRCETSDIATYYMTARTCPYSRSILERALEGGYSFLSGVIGTESCAQIERMHEHFDVINAIGSENCFKTIMDTPMKYDDSNLNYYIVQARKNILKPMNENYGIDISDASIRKTIESHNEKCRVITEIGSFRKLDNPPITGYEFHVLQLISETCPWYLVRDKMLETLEEIKNRECEEKFPFRARVVLVGSENDEPEFTKLIESCGAMVVADRYCYGSFPGREEIEIKDGEDALTAVCRHYLYWIQCARFFDDFKRRQRITEVHRLAEEFKADGIIYTSMKFCELWTYEKVIAPQILSRECSVPCCTIEKEYTLGGAGQLRTRIQALVESLEIKKINS